MLLSWTKNLLRIYGIKPTKRLGQNFLVRENARTKFVSAASITKNDVIFEVGAGIGTITVELAKLAKGVVAVEKDKALIPILKKNTVNFKNIKVIAGDILKIDWPLVIGHWSLAGNIPYYLTAHLIRKFLESDNPPKTMTIMIQKEMALRICAKPPNMSILSVSVQVYAKPAIISYVPRSSFWPQPEVDSAILRITSIHADSKTDLGEFFKIVRAGFSSPRKQLVNNLSREFNISREETKQWLASCDIDPERRAETLAVKEWLCLKELSP